MTKRGANSISIILTVAVVCVLLLGSYFWGGENDGAQALATGTLISAASVNQYQTSENQRSLFIFFDANCSFCNKQYYIIKSLKAAFLEADVVARWIPVSIVSNSSLGRGAAILIGGMKAMEKNEALFDARKEQGGIDPITAPAPTGKVRANNRIFQNLDFFSVPTLVWCESGAFISHSGVIGTSDLADIVKQISPRKSCRQLSQR